MKQIVRTISGLLPIALLSACATTGEITDKVAAKPVATATETPTPSPAAEISIAPEQRKKINPLEDPASLLAKRIIYFDYDKSDVRSEYHSIIQAHAEYIANHPRLHIRLEGHADERGTRDYNDALGERRGSSVLALLSLHGAAEGQIDTISYGEKRPLKMGHDESSWRLNRRVEIVYR